MLFIYRSLRKWWGKLPDEEKKSYKKKLYISRGRIMAAASILMLAGVVNYVTHLQETPITKRRRYIAFTPEQFMKIANFEYEMVGFVIGNDKCYKMDSSL